MTVISSRKPKSPVHTIQSALDAIKFAMPNMVSLTIGQGETYLAGFMKSLEFMKVIDNSLVVLHPTASHYDIAFQMVGDSQFYYVAIAVSKKP